MAAAVREPDALDEPLPPPVFEVERMSRAERNQRFREALILDPAAAAPEVRGFLEQATRRYLDRFNAG